MANDDLKELVGGGDRATYDDAEVERRAEEIAQSQQAYEQFRKAYPDDQNKPVTIKVNGEEVEAVSMPNEATSRPPTGDTTDETTTDKTTNGDELTKETTTGDAVPADPGTTGGE